METIKLSAQFVARNGQKFLQGLTEREIRNPRFDFLKPTHVLFNYFTSLVEAYSRVQHPKNETLQRHQAFADPTNGLSEVCKAGEWRQMYQAQQEQIAKQEALNNPEFEDNSEMDSEDVDWHDFVVVEQIELYDDNEMTE